MIPATTSRPEPGYIRLHCPESGMAYDYNFEDDVRADQVNALFTDDVRPLITLPHGFNHVDAPDGKQYIVADGQFSQVSDESIEAFDDWTINPSAGFRIEGFRVGLRTPWNVEDKRTQVFEDLDEAIDWLLATFPEPVIGEPVMRLVGDLPFSKTSACCPRCPSRIEERSTYHDGECFVVEGECPEHGLFRVRSWQGTGEVAMDIEVLQEYTHGDNRVLVGDVTDRLKTVEDESVDCIITSPPYYKLRKYLEDHPNLQPMEIGQEDHLSSYLHTLVNDVFGECMRVLKPNGTLWVNIGDRYVESAAMEKANTDIGLLRGNLMQIPQRFELAMTSAGWILRDRIIWAKGISGTHRLGNPSPDNVRNRTSSTHEPILMFTKTASGYHYDADAIKEPCKTTPKEQVRGFAAARNGKHTHGLINGRRTGSKSGGNGVTMGTLRNVWIVKSSRGKHGHIAPFPESLVEIMLKAGCPRGGLVLDPFMGSGTVGVVAKEQGKGWLGCELNPEYAILAVERIQEAAGPQPTKQTLAAWST